LNHDLQQDLQDYQDFWAVPNSEALPNPANLVDLMKIVVQENGQCFVS